MLRTVCPVVLLWLLSPTGFAQTDASFVDRVEAAADPAVLDLIVASPPATPELVAALRHRADALFQAGGYEKSARLNRAAVAIATRAGDAAETARAWRSLGLCYRRMGRQADSLHAYEEGLKAGLAAGDKVISAELYRGVGVARRALGENQAAIEAYQRSIALCEEAHDRDCALRSITNLGGVYSTIGDFRRSVEVLQQGLAQVERLGDGTELSLLNNLAVAYIAQGDPETARVYLERQLELARAQQSKGDIAFALTNLVPLYREIDPDLARRSADEGLRLAEATGQANVVGTMLANLAAIERAQGRDSEALAHLAACLETFQRLGQRQLVAGALAEIAAIHADMRHDAEALDWAGRAQAEARATGHVNALYHALDAAGRTQLRLGRHDEARAAFTEAISLVEAGRTRLAGGDIQTRRFLDSRANPYYGLVEMQVEKKEYEAALQTLESAKARLLVDVLENGRIDVSRSMTPAERRQEEALAAAVESKLPAVLRGEPAARAQWESAQRELDAYRVRLYASHPELKLRRAQFTPFSVADAAALLPDTRTALIDFALTGDRIFAFVLVRNRQGEPSLTVSSSPWNATEAAAQVEAFRRALAERSLGYRGPAAALYRRIFGPIAAQLRGKTMLGIVPDGVLWGAPFQALIEPGGRHVMEGRAIFYAPSLTALRETRRRHHPSANSRATVLAFGAPSAGGFAGSLPPLSESAREVSRIGALYGHHAAAVYVGPAAAKRLWLSEAPRHQILHLATHGVLNTANPLYSYLVLSDGVLEAREILNMDLHARLVVLSACETGRGNVISGEGLVGMSWAFLVAGSPATVVSQWKVDSASTSELMFAFHRAYGAAGASPTRALQHAALEVMKTPAFRHPFYWAGFVVMGVGY